ncbi:facilitated trehalose transporter Tret1 [Nilaparvata lugens]|uniref:Sugar transporter 11 n=1 Tax=Nilaparvata lugens TaxID=108931 RepID=D4AHX6_NILLU|nr:facilitated trehalose transporter Tret1 [Nilaparvata lugens]BAI83425.1 sugar transporter 11 [Nilaparvata lugens]
MVTEKNLETAAYGETIITEGRKFPQFLAAFFATIAALVVGISLAWTSPTFPIYKRENLLTTEQRGWISSLLSIGALFGALTAGMIVDRFGRKLSLLLLGFPTLAAWALLSFSTSVDALYAARAIIGYCSGATSVAVNLYTSEIAENSVRGKLGTFYQLQITVGILYTYIAGIADNVQIISIICGVTPIVFMVCFVWMPESPAYLVSKGRDEEARRVLRWLRGPDYQHEVELSLMKHSMEQQKKNQAGFMDVISDKVILKAFVLSLGMMVFQQLSGVNAVIFYSGQIFESAGSSLSSQAASIVIGVVQVLATYCSTLLVERTGRRFLLLLSDSVMAICLIVLGGYFHYKEQNVDLSTWGWVPLVSLSLFIVVFSLGFGPIPWIIMGEIVPSNLKGISSSLGAGTSWILAFVVTKYFENLELAFGSAGTFWLFAGICVVGTLFVYTLLPETKGKDIETILDELGGKKPELQLYDTKN